MIENELQICKCFLSVNSENKLIPSLNIREKGFGKGCSGGTGGESKLSSWQQLICTCQLSILINYDIHPLKRVRQSEWKSSNQSRCGGLSSSNNSINKNKQRVGERERVLWLEVMWGTNNQYSLMNLR